MSTTMTFRVHDDEKELITDFSKTFGMTSSEYIRKTVLEAIDDAIDYKAAIDAIEEFDADPISFTHDEMMAEFGLS